MYVTRRCPFCLQAQRLLDDKGVEYAQIDLDVEPDKRAEMEQRSGGRDSVPQIFIGAHHVGGCDDLYALDKRGELDPLLGLVPVEKNSVMDAEVKSLVH
ncbi:MAG: glutaredoxin 3 [Gammaproteobacteria bacterium]|nr:glutaredoxin 3 [Gammaproteobacteria bacterium]MDH5800270.1 glutaredoxin 3 [Gammaproteobacteria bacterium]